MKRSFKGAFGFGKLRAEVRHLEAIGARKEVAGHLLGATGGWLLLEAFIIRTKGFYRVPLRDSTTLRL